VNAAEISLEEIQLGILAQKNCLTNDVRQVGKMMENDHTKSLVELQQLATQKSISIPTVQSDKAFDVYKELSNKTGNKFDNEYCAIMLKGHKKAIVLFEKAVSDTADDDIRNWATKMLTVLRLHLDYIINCQKNISK
jgi:putative membrane protein